MKGRMMYKLLAMMFIFFASQSFAADTKFYFDKNFRAKDMKNVKIMLVDQARGGCWTNSKEINKVLKQRFKELNVRVLSKNTGGVQGKDYIFYVFVSAQRLKADGTGPCFGYMLADLSTQTKLNKRVHSAKAMEYTRGLWATNSNLNEIVMNSALEAIKSLR